MMSLFGLLACILYFAIYLGVKECNWDLMIGILIWVVIGLICYAVG